jgi:hypothetical protein
MARETRTGAQTVPVGDIHSDPQDPVLLGQADARSIRLTAEAERVLWSVRALLDEECLRALRAMTAASGPAGVSPAAATRLADGLGGRRWTYRALLRDEASGHAYQAAFDTIALWAPRLLVGTRARMTAISAPRAGLPGWVEIEFPRTRGARVLERAVLFPCPLMNFRPGESLLLPDEDQSADDYRWRLHSFVGCVPARGVFASPY